MLFQLKLHGLRYRLNLANRDELRLAAFTALNAGICTPSLLEAALDAEDRLDEIGSAFEKTLQELGITLPASREDCCWAMLRYYINQIAKVDKSLLWDKNLTDVVEVCLRSEASDVYEIYALCDAARGYDFDLRGERLDVVEYCKAWLERHPEAPSYLCSC
jgi:hypothetical protein